MLTEIPVKLSELVIVLSCRNIKSLMTQISTDFLIGHKKHKKFLPQINAD
jgi:hypothetical protein